MQSIPETIRQTLKKRSMVGADAPKCTLTFTDPVTDLTVQPSSVRISRDSATLSARLVASWPNVNPDDPTDAGYYSPDRGDDVAGDKNNWYRVVMPGANFTCSMGYGNQTAQVFKGQVDDVELRADPRQGGGVDYDIAIDCRDDAWRLLDQIVEDGAGNFELSYTATAIETIVNDLLQKAGFAAGDIDTTEATGISATVTFTRETYADALEWCMEVSGFELSIDFEGDATFYYPTDRQPAITNLAVVLNGTTAVDITGGSGQGKAPVVSGSQVVTNTAGTITYVKDTDYTITYGSQTTEATLARIATGAITDGQTVHVDYVYAAWIFREGEDLFRLPYRITRRNVYGKITVIGQNSAGAEVSGTYTYPNRADFGIPDDKVLFVEIPELDTAAKCQAAADQMGNDMIRRVREIVFAAVAVPWLEVGDVVQVIESSSTASETYRITGMELQLDQGGFIMTCTAYFYGYAPL